MDGVLVGSAFALPYPKTSNAERTINTNRQLGTQYRALMQKALEKESGHSILTENGQQRTERTAEGLSVSLLTVPDFLDKRQLPCLLFSYCTPQPRARVSVLLIFS